MLILRNNHTLEQKEFGIASNFKSGVKKVTDGTRNIISSGWLINQIERCGANVSNKIKSNEGVNNKTLLKKSIREGRKYGARTVSPDTFYSPRVRTRGGSFTTSTKELKEDLTKGDTGLNKSKKFKNIVDSNKEVIVLDTKAFVPGKGTVKTARADSHAHEVGHLKNTADKKWYIKRSSSEGRDIITTPMHEDTGIGVKEALRRVPNVIAVVQDEKDANKNAMKFLKDNGASRKELKTAKRNFRHGAWSYRLAGAASILSPIQNSIKPKERRRK